MGAGLLDLDKLPSSLDTDIFGTTPFCSTSALSSSRSDASIWKKSMFCCDGSTGFFRILNGFAAAEDALRMTVAAPTGI